jgi:uncharacterized protein YkwD
MRAWLRGTALVCSLLAGCPEEEEAGSQPKGTRTLDDAPHVLEDAGLSEADAAVADAGVDAEAAYSTDDVPEGEHCAAVARWDAAWAQFEEEVVIATNEARAKGQDCRTYGQWGPAGPVVMEPRLRCAARLHALYMSQAIDDFGHESRDGSVPRERVLDSGYLYSVLGENLAVNLDSPEEVVEGWLESDGHCKVLMQPEFTEVGIGYAFGKWDTCQRTGIIDAPYVAQELATPQ